VCVLDSVHVYNTHRYRWLDQAEDWCISRQLWWGHRVPAFRVLGVQGHPDAERWVVSDSLEGAHAQAQRQYSLLPGAYTLEQDEDVLDTWFSSSLFPLSVFNWPHDSPALSTFYPLSLMETGSDILFFWVARCVVLYTCTLFKTHRRTHIPP
jgi:valyl-tRNA synthetase